MDNAGAAGPVTTLRLRHRFEASPERVFEAWTRPETLRRWWCPAGWHPAEVAVDLRVGGTHRLAMWCNGGARVVAVHCSFLEIEPGRLLIYTWQWEGAFPDMPPTCVTVEFHACAGGTELALSQADVTMRHCAQHLSGWLAAYQRIDTILQVRSRAAISAS